MSSLDYLDLCRLCLVKDRVSVPIFDGEGDVRQIFLKIAACLPVKVAREDKLPKKICDDCVYKVELFYQFWNTTANAEKQLLQWLGDVGLEEKQGYVSEVLSSEIMKQEESENRLDVSVMQATGEHTDNMAINIIDDMNLGIPIIMSTDQQITVPINSNNNVQTGQSVPGPSARSTHDQVTPKSAVHDAEEDTSEDDNTDDDCDADEGLAVKEEGEDTTSGNRAIEPTTFVNVALACDEAGPSGLQQQKLVEMPTMGIQQSSEGDPKSGEAETFGGLSGMLRQILSPSLETGDGIFSGCCNLQPSIFTNYSSMLSQNVQHIAPMSLPYIHTTQSPSLTSLDQMSAMDPVGIHVESHPCLSCGLEFRSALKLNYHIRTNHPININDIRRRHDSNTNENIGNNQMKFTCSMCDRIFSNLNHLRMHETTHIMNTSNQQMQHNNFIQTNVSLMPASEQSIADQTFSCDRCQASFRYRTLLDRHKKMHMTGQDKPYGCSRCPMRFETRTLYNHHAKTHKTIHGSPQPTMSNIASNISHSTIATSTPNVTMDKPSTVESPISYPCDSCAKQFLTVESLTSHKAVHRSRPLVCDVCGKGFTHRKYYVVHQRIHTGERPYLCAMCGKSFTQASTLTVHRRYHTGERPYTCTLCGKGFVTRTIMLNHMKKH
ncbi:hypothetical protein PV327_000042 [Microctonus hyperodae]|uniref:Uncharacterized protein n=1 Tax=Microctonus hyperodae TaxID=165561 RepID=A0AA39L1R5_MICHY|nr:hypothetical protein PV327_000042 [Microctonus hyperodae]